MGGTKKDKYLMFSYAETMAICLIVHNRQQGTRGQATAAENDHSRTWGKLQSGYLSGRQRPSYSAAPTTSKEHGSVGKRSPGQASGLNI